MADISVIKLPNGNSYNLKDTTARSTANSAVPNTRTVNGKALSSNISLGAGDVEAYTKKETDTKINAAIASAYKYKGSVTADKLPTSGQVVGDVYNITNDSSYGKAGMNVAWTGTTWDALGSNVDLSNYVTTSDSRLSNARPASDVYAWAKAAKKPSYSASEINGLGSLATKNGLSAGDVGLGNVANIDQSKAIKSITRNGTTFTATALDGTTSTFTQQDTNTTYGVATSSADGLMSKSDKAKLDGIDPSAITTNAANIKKNADAISAETTRAKAAEKANADTISAEVTRAKKAEEANTQLTNDLKTGLTSGTVKVAKATVADSASSLGKVSTYQTEIPDNGARRKYLLMYDITDWISAKSNAPTRAFDGHFFSRRSNGLVGTNYTGNLSIVASYNGVNSDGSPIKSDNGISLRLRTTSSTYVPGILHQKSNDKYYLSLMTYGSGRDLILFGIFQGTFIGRWINNEGANYSNGTLPSDYEEYSDGFYSIPYEKAICDKNGKDITEYLVAAAYADGAFTFTRGNGSKTVLTIPDAVSNTVNSHIANKSSPHGVTKAQVGLGSVANLDQSKAIKSITRSGTTFTATALDGTQTTFTQQDTNTTYPVATTSTDGLMSKTDKAKLDGLSDSGIHYVPFKQVDDTACSTTDSFNTVMSMLQANKPVQASVNVDGKVIALPVFMYDGGEIMFRNDEMYIIWVDTFSSLIQSSAIYGYTLSDKLQDNDTTETSGQAALDAHMGKVLSDRINAVKTGAIDQIVKNTAQIETAGTATNAHSAGEYVMISNALYKVAASVAKGDTWTIGTNVTAANIGGEISSLKSDLANKLYPVGSIYMSVNPTNPAELFGGIWKRIQDQFLLAASNTYPVGSVGGEATHTLSAAEMPSHAHTVRIWDPQGTMGDAQGASAATYGATLTTVPNGATTSLTWNNSTPKVAMNGMGDLAGVTEFSGGGKQHNNMPPYFAVYVWLRVDYQYDY